MWAKFGQMARKTMDITKNAKSKVKGYGVQTIKKYKSLTPIEKTTVVGTGLALGIGLPLKGAAFYYGAKAGSEAIAKNKNKKKKKNGK